MILNFILVLALFGASKKKFNPYAAAAVLGAIKGVLYFLSSRNVLVAAFAGLVFFGLAATMVYFLSRVDKKEEGEEHYSKYGRVKKGPFKWDYVPLSVAVFLMLFGEIGVMMLLS
jgi:hypothetical protein